VVVYGAANDEKPTGGAAHVNVLAVVAGICRSDANLWKLFIRAIDREVDEVADDVNAVADADRASIIADLDRQILAFEHHECALVEAAVAAGVPVTYRPDTDPRAWFALADDAPPPRRQPEDFLFA
jgi:hypothetical protein